MEIARHVFDTYFKDTPNALVRHHLDSYGNFLSTMIPNFVQGLNPLPLIFEDDRKIEIFIGGKKGNKIRYVPPVDEIGNAVLPHKCRLENTTYAMEVRVDIDVEYTIGKDVESKSFENVLLAKLPIMLKSQMCYLSPMTSDELSSAGECKFELGGYFVIGGAEKVLLTQERLGDNMFYASKRAVKPLESPGGKSLVEKESASLLEGATKEDRFEYTAAVRCISEDGTKGPYSHFLVIPPENAKPDDPNKLSSISDFSQFSVRRLAVLTLPGFSQPVPLISVFRALSLTSDQDIYDTILCGIPEHDRSQYDELFAELILSHETFTVQEMAKEEDQTQDPDLLFLRRQCRTRSNAGVYVNLYDQMFPHTEVREGESAASFYRRKAYMLGYMVRMAMDVALGLEPKTDREHYRFKRLVASGELCFQEFRRVYKETAKRMLTELDTRVHFEQQIYAGKKLVELINVENIGYYWRSYNFMNEFEKSFKGKWGGKDGISQELTRFAYIGTIAQLRRVNVDLDKGTKIVEPRRIHCSSWGIMCPTDNPDGGGVGLTKSLATFSRITTANPTKDILKHIKAFKQFTALEIIHPSTWDPRWTKVFLNSDFIGVVEQDTEDFHSEMLEKRRSGVLNRFVSLCWSRINNTYIISADAGRGCRPIYQEGTTSAQIKKLKKWEDMVSKHMDYIDAQETESLRISMEPFSADKPSEIHGTLIFSASASILPYSDFDPATRNAFSCQQMKQSCSWYNTAFNKRFDTISTWLNYAQRAIAQTWAYKHIFGTDGCLGYGENPIVALAVFSGYNQEDSVLLNESALERGMFQTTYYHSYDVEESMIDIPAQIHTEFANVATDPKYRETVSRKEGYDYSYLDSDGIIKVGSPVTEQTILVGIVTPVMNQTGQVTAYRDKSVDPKRGQTGHVDAVYRYVTKEGLHAVKIRVSEHRVPVLGDKFCLTDDHDVLTRNRGWVSIADVKTDDLVYTLNRETGTGEYVHPNETFEFDCDEKLYEVETQGVSLKTTLNHRMWIKQRNSTHYELAEAKDMIGKRVNFQSDAPLGCDDLTFDIGEYHFAGHDMDSWIELLGIWIAEGWTYIKEKDYIARVEIAANKPRVQEALKRICHTLELRYNFNEKSKKFYINDKTIATYLDQFSVGAVNKILPEWTLDLSANQSAILVKGMCLGDGHETDTSLAYYTSSIQLRDQLQQIVQHAGWTSEFVKHNHAGSSHVMGCGRTITCTVDSWKIGIRRLRVRPTLNHGHSKSQGGQTEKLVEHIGKVYCISVPSEVFLVRRNGKCVFTGNSARHGQKGTVGLRLREEDMPYTASGMRPDMIVNPHAFPSRMTIGQFIEMMATKASVHLGALADATAFSTQDRVGDTKELLLKLGYHPYGHELLYNGQTGEMIESEIFMAPTYYIRSKLMTEDKINSRATGPRKLLTHQPVEGRSNDGGLRIGEMERDVLISHGISKFLNESLMERSDKTEILFDPEMGVIDSRAESDSTVLTAPYALSLAIHELESMHISVKLVGASN